MTEHFTQKMEAALKFIPYPNLVMIFSLAAFLQENVRHARWGHSNQRSLTVLWVHRLMVKIWRMWSQSPSQTEKKRSRSTIHLLVFTQGVYWQSPQCKVCKTFVCRWSSLFAMFRKHVESPSWTFTFSLSFQPRFFIEKSSGWYWEML